MFERLSICFLVIFFENVVYCLLRLLLKLKTKLEPRLFSESIGREMQIMFFSQICFHSEKSMHGDFNFTKNVASCSLGNSTAVGGGGPIIPSSRP